MKRHILIRFDDICPTMDRSQWEAAESILKKYDIKPLLGVIPDCKDPVLMIDEARDDFWEWLKEKQSEGYTIAMHGCCHSYTSGHRGMINSGFESEFAGLPYETQYELICRGRDILKKNGIETDIFFAPSHSYDKNTLKALCAAGFGYMSDGMSGKAYMYKELLCLPCRSFGVPKIRSRGYYTAVFHAHEWSRPDKAAEKLRLQQLCEKYGDAGICTFDEYKEQPPGNYALQRVSEIAYVFYQRHIRPVLSKVKRKIIF